jgi:hypothetical protein
MKTLGAIPTTREPFPLKCYAKPRDPRFRRSDQTARYTGWTLRRDSIHAVRFVEDPKGIDYPPEDAT